MQTTAEVSDGVRRGVGRPQCRCGCGTTVKTAGRQFAQGHHARVASRNEAGQLIPIYVLGLCECDCGERVLTRGARFRPGHHARTAEWKQAVFPEGSQQRKCPECGEDFNVVQSDTVTVFCAPAHRIAYRFPRGWCRLQHRIRARQIKAGRTLKDFAREAKQPYETVRQWFKNKDRCVSRAFLLSVVEVVGEITIEDAIKEAGGKTDDERRAELGKELIEKNRPKAGTAKFTAMRDKMVESHRGKHLSRDAKRKRTAGQQARGSSETTSKQAHARTAFATAAQSTPGRIRSRLMGFLRHNRTPSHEDLEKKFEEIGKEVGASASAVLNVCRPHLQKRRLWGTGGVKPDEERCGRIRGALGSEGITADTEQAPYGFWKRSAVHEPETEDSENITRPGAHEQMMFWRRHVCANCLEDRRLRRSVQQLHRKPKRTREPNPNRSRV